MKKDLKENDYLCPICENKCDSCIDTCSYPLWLVPLYLARELKKIGFDKFTQNIYSEYTVYKEGYRKVFASEYILAADKSLSSNKYDSYTDIPTYLQVIDWFRRKGYRTKIDDGGTWIHWSFYNVCIEPEIKEKEPIEGYETEFYEAYEELIKAIIKVEKEQQIILKLKENGNT